ncbi:MAG: HEAT repeat domain-containing protein [Candidatus Heimdallarchaeaceae archaeon]
MTENSSKDEKTALIKQLRLSSLPVQREKAAILLANFPDSEVLDALLNAQIRDPNPKVRDAAAASLARLISYSEDDDSEILPEDKKKRYNQIFNLTKEIEIIRQGTTRFRFNKKDTLEITQLFNQIKSDRYLPKQTNVRSLINSILLLPIDNIDLGRDIAITLTEILKRSFDEEERLIAIGSLSNIVTTIESYNPLFGIAEAFLMIYKTSDDSEMRMISFRCLELLISKTKSMNKLNYHVDNLAKLLTFSYDKRIREIAISAYPELVFLYNEKSTFLVDHIIKIVRATYEDRLRELGLKALEALILRKRVTEENFESIIKMLKSHHSKNIRIRAIELFLSIILQAHEDMIDDALASLFIIMQKTKDEDICYTAIQNIEHYSLIDVPKENVQNVFRLIEIIATTSPHPLIALRAYNLVSKIISNKPNLITTDFIVEIAHNMLSSKDLGVTEQILVSFCELIYNRELNPLDLTQNISNILFLSDDSDILEGLVTIFQELLVSDKSINPKDVLDKLIVIISESNGKHDVFRRLANLDVDIFKKSSNKEKSEKKKTE